MESTHIVSFEAIVTRGSTIDGLFKFDWKYVIDHEFSNGDCFACIVTNRRLYQS